MTPNLAHGPLRGTRRSPRSRRLIAPLLSALAGTLASCLPANGPGVQGGSGNPTGPGASQAPSAAASPTPAGPTPAPTPVPDAPPEKKLRILMTTSSTHTVTVEIKDEAFNPVRTDLWFYRLEGTDYVPFKGVTPLQSNHRRRSANFMLPAEVLGTPTGFNPAADGGLHGVLTDGSDRKQIDGKVDIKLGETGVPDGTKILIAAALEDQRYYGARVFELPSGLPSDAPRFDSPVQHKLRTYEGDVKAILDRATCTACHGPHGKAERLPLLTYRDLVERNFKAPPGQEFDQTLSGEHMLEPGVPALSGIVRRAQPGLGEEPKKWYGKPTRYNLDLSGNVVSDRRMPPQDVAGLAPDSDGPPSYFDTHLDEYRIFWEWVAQGAPEK